MNASPFVARLSLAVAASVFLISTGCGDSSPTAPTPVTSAPPTQPGPAPTAPTAPTATGALSITINPNPVPHSGAAITDAAGCAGVRFTWFYDQVLRETGGVAVTLTNRIDLFDDRETNNLGVNIVVPANGSTTVRSRWCSSTRAAHSSQTRWSGTDAAGRSISVLGPKVILNTP